MKNYLKLNDKRREKLSNIILDIVKYMITVILAALMFDDMRSWNIINYVLSGIFIVLLALMGFDLIDDDKDSKTDKK